MTPDTIVDNKLLWGRTLTLSGTFPNLTKFFLTLMDLQVVIKNKVITKLKTLIDEIACFRNRIVACISKFINNCRKPPECSIKSCLTGNFVPSLDIVIREMQNCYFADDLKLIKVNKRCMLNCESEFILRCFN